MLIAFVDGTVTMPGMSAAPLLGGGRGAGLLGLAVRLAGRGVGLGGLLLRPFDRCLRVHSAVLEVGDLLLLALELVAVALEGGALTGQLLDQGLHGSLGGRLRER